MSVNLLTQFQYFIVIFIFCCIVLINVKDDPGQDREFLKTGVPEKGGGASSKYKYVNAIWDVKSTFYLH